jgi:hypothetical protein
MCARSFASPRQPIVPISHEHAQFVSEREHFFNPSVQLFQALANETPNGNARRAAPIADGKYSFQVCEGETDYERSLNQQHAVDRSGRVLPVPGRCSCDSRKKSLSLVVPKGIGADPSRLGDITRPHRHTAHRVRTVVGSPVLCSAI